MESEWRSCSARALARLLSSRPEKVLVRTSGYISHVRVSRQGDAIAFADHPVLGDDRGYVAMVDSQGKSKRLTKEWSSLRGLAWSSSGKEIWFTASENGEPQGLVAVDRQGKTRNILRSPGDLWLQDISASGKVLLGNAEMGGGVAFHSGPATADRPVDVGSESSDVDGISSDGSHILVTYSGASAGVDYSAYVANNDGSQPIRLGDGSGIEITPDGKHILVVMPTAPSHFRLYPTGTGEPRDNRYQPGLRA